MQIPILVTRSPAMQVNFQGKKVEARRIAKGEGSGGSNPIYIGMKKVRSPWLQMLYLCCVAFECKLPGMHWNTES